MEYNRGYNCAFNSSASFPPFRIKTARTRPFSAAAMNYPSRRPVFGRNRVVSLRVIEKSCARELSAARERERERVRRIRLKSNSKGILPLRNSQHGTYIYRHAESSVSLFAMPANLSGPIPTSRGKKTFDKRPDIPAVGPRLGFARTLAKSWSTSKETNGSWTKFDIVVVNDGRINFD